MKTKKFEDWIIDHSIALFASLTSTLGVVILLVFWFSTGFFHTDPKPYVFLGVLFTVYGVVQNDIIILYERRQDKQLTELLTKILTILEEDKPKG